MSMLSALQSLFAPRYEVRISHPVDHEGAGSPPSKPAPSRRRRARSGTRRRNVQPVAAPQRQGINPDGMFGDVAVQGVIPPGTGAPTPVNCRLLH